MPKLVEDHEFSDNESVIQLESDSDDDDVCQKTLKLKQQPVEESAVVYLGRIPHGFYEAEMHGYFSQFGVIKNLRLARNKKVDVNLTPDRRQ